LRFTNPAVDRADVIADEGLVIQSPVERLTGTQMPHLAAASMAAELKIKSG
jgi:hypothetical protein